MFKTVCKKLYFYRTLQVITRVGNKDYVFVITKPSCTEADNERILNKLKEIAEAEYGDSMYAFQTKIHAGKGCDWRKTSGAKVMVIIPPYAYNPEKRKKGWSSSYRNLLEWIGDYEEIIKKDRK